LLSKFDTFINIFILYLPEKVVEINQTFFQPQIDNSEEQQSKGKEIQI